MAGGGAKKATVKAVKEKDEPNLTKKEAGKDDEAKKKKASSVDDAQADTDAEEADEQGGNGLTWREWLYTGLAVVAMGASAAAMVVEGSPLVNVVGVACTVLGPAAAIKQRKIEDMEELKRTQKRLEERVKELKAENDRLDNENNRLEASTKKLSDTEAALATINNIEGQNLDLMAKQLEQFRKIEEGIADNLEASVIQNMISIVVRSDKDNDFKISPDETDELVRRLANINGVKFNEKNFRRLIQGAGCDVRAIISITRNLLDDSVSDEDNIFIIEKKK